MCKSDVGEISLKPSHQMLHFQISEYEIQHSEERQTRLQKVSKFIPSSHTKTHFYLSHTLLRRRKNNLF